MVCPPTDLHKIWEMLHVQLWSGWKPLVDDFKRRNRNGLEIMLDIQQDEYLPVWGDTGEQYIKKDISNVFS